MKKKNEVLTFRPSRYDKAYIKRLKKLLKVNRSEVIRRAIAQLAKHYEIS